MELMKTLLAVNFPNLTVENITVNNIREREFLDVVNYIRDNRLVQDSKTLLGGKYLRSSVKYEINFTGQLRRLDFEVELIRDGDIYIGYLETRNSRKGLFVARFYNMKIVK